MNHQRLNLIQFQQAVTAANRHFTELREKHPGLRAYLLLSLRGGQTEPDNELVKSLKVFPSMFLDNLAKNQMLRLIKELKPDEATKPVQIRLRNEIRELAEDLEFDGNVQVELRFHNPDYELIWKLQTDDLVDRDLTPQTKASIRIVLGTISQFLSAYTKQEQP